jgi:hypothetical protein
VLGCSGVINITLTTHPRAGTIRLPGVTHELATWHNAGAGLLLGTTTDGQRVTLATETADDDGHIAGSITIGNTLDAPRWDIWNARREGSALVGLASLAVADAWMAAAFPGCGWDAP